MTIDDYYAAIAALDVLLEKQRLTKEDIQRLERILAAIQKFENENYFD